MIPAHRPLVCLRHRRAAELACPDNQRIVEHAALFQIGDQRRTGLIDFASPQRQFFPQQAVVVPVAMVELNEPDAPLGQPSGQQAIAGKRTVAWFATVELKHLAAFVRAMSTSSGTLTCMRKAISYCAMRVAISGSFTQR